MFPPGAKRATLLRATRAQEMFLGFSETSFVSRTQSLCLQQMLRAWQNESKLEKYGLASNVAARLHAVPFFLRAAVSRAVAHLARASLSITKRKERDCVQSTSLPQWVLRGLMWVRNRLSADIRFLPCSHLHFESAVTDTDGNNSDVTSVRSPFGQ